MEEILRTLTLEHTMTRGQHVNNGKIAGPKLSGVLDYLDLDLQEKDVNAVNTKKDQVSYSPQQLQIGQLHL